jgi:enamine deaminase RidA (YjgF/YER057c/UK114 family)
MPHPQPHHPRSARRIAAALALGALAGAAGCRTAAAGNGLTRSNPPGLAPSPAYSHAVGASLDGRRLLFVAGQVATDSAGRLVGGRSAAAQADQVFRNLATVLAANGAGFEDVLKLTIFVTDSTARDSIAAVRRRYVAGPPPASTFVEVRRLFRDEWLVEIEAVATAPAPGRGARAPR